MNESIFIYEDTFLSLLNLIHYLWKNNIKPFNIKNTMYTPNLLDQVIHPNIDEDENIANTIIKNIGQKSFRLLYYVFLSTDENKEIIIYYFYINAIKYKENIFYYRNLKCVEKALKLAHYVSRENHKYKGFIRFKELENNILYAEIEPVNDILFLVSHHFQKRLKNEYWIIKDVKRGIVSIYDTKKYFLVSESDFTLKTNLESYKESQIEDLWKTFYKTIGIKERKNDRCRMNFMPKRYWKYMLEVESEL